MKEVIKKSLKGFVIVCALICLTTTAIAHSGRTDANGGHYDHSTGDYHYHHGYPAHKHPNGECPYKFKDKTNHDDENDEDDEVDWWAICLGATIVGAVVIYKIKK